MREIDGGSTRLTLGRDFRSGCLRSKSVAFEAERLQPGLVEKANRGKKPADQNRQPEIKLHGEEAFFLRFPITFSRSFESAIREAISSAAGRLEYPASLSRKTAKT